MTLALLALLTALADTTQPAPPEPPPDPARQVVTRAEIEATGLYRLPDLWRLIDGVRTATVDGFTWRASFGYGDPFGAETWTLLVDGERVEIGLFGEQNLSLVPVAITQVDSVEVWTEPRLVAGTLAHGGVLHIHTTRMAQGTAVRGGVAIGNEIGDPGPFRYVPERFSRNVDKFGADYDALASATREQWSVQARFKLLRFYATDFAVIERTSEALGANPALRLFAPAVRLEADALGGTHAFSVLGGGANDLWFFRPFGREIPVRRVWGQAGLHGRVPVTPHATIRYRLAVAENRLDEWEGAALRLDPQWETRTARAGVDAQRHVGSHTAGVGLEVRRTTANAAEGFTLGTVTGHAATTTARYRYGVEGALAAADGSVAASMVLHARRTWGRWTVSARGARTQQLPEQAGRFGFWVRQGYTSFAQDIGVRLQATSIEQREAPRTSTQHGLRLDLTGRLGSGLALDAGLGVRRVDDAYFESQARAPDPGPELTYLAPPTFLGAEGKSTTATGRVAIRVAHRPWSGCVFYDGLAVLGGNLDREWEAVPRHRAGATATLAADPGFTLSSTLAYRSAARWPAYELLTGANGGLYDAAVPAAWLLDAALEKWLWQRRLRMSLLFRNLLNQEERYHPIGAALDLRFYLRVELNL